MAFILNFWTVFEDITILLRICALNFLPDVHIFYFIIPPLSVLEKGLLYAYIKTHIYENKG